MRDPLTQSVRDQMADFLVEAEKSYPGVIRRIVNGETEYGKPLIRENTEIGGKARQEAIVDGRYSPQTDRDRMSHALKNAPC